MFNPVKKLIPALLLIVTPVFAVSIEEPFVMVPLLPTDNSDNVKFTKESFQKLLDSRKVLAGKQTPALAVDPGGKPGPYPISFTNQEAVEAIVGCLITDNYLTGITDDYLEGAPPGTTRIEDGWAWQTADVQPDGPIARSIYGQVGLSLIQAIRHYPELYQHQEIEGSSPYNLLEARILMTAWFLKRDYENGGPLSVTDVPFMADVLFLAIWSESGLQHSEDYDYLGIAQDWFDKVKLGGQRTAEDEVNRIYQARLAQGVPELTGYDVGLLIMAAEAVGDDVYASEAEDELDRISWEVVQATMLANGNDDAVKSSTGNMLSRALLMVADPVTYDYATFFQGAQRSEEGEFNGYDSDGSFLPAGNIESNSWIITALAFSEDGTNWGVAREGCKYLLETQNYSGGWNSYPLFDINESYNSEIAAALLAISSTAYTVVVEDILDREGNEPLGNMPIQLAGGADIEYIRSSATGGPAVVPAILYGGSLTLTFQLDEDDEDELRMDVIGATDASVVLEEALKDTPFGVSGGLYGDATLALHSANLTKKTGFSSGDVSSQIASEILAYAVDNEPLVLSANFDLNYVSVGNLVNSFSLNYDYSGSLELGSISLVLLGDITNTLASQGGIPTTLLLAGAAPVGPMKLSIETCKLDKDKLLLPIVLADYAAEMEAPKAFQFELTYDATKLTYLGMRTGEVTEGFLFAHNGSEPGLVRVAMASALAAPANGSIAWLEFRLKAEYADLKGFSLQKAMINEMAAVGTSGIAQLALKLAEGLALPKAFSLSQNSPNPFNPSTAISYHIPVTSEPVEVKLTVFNIRGQWVRTLVNAQQSAGSYTVHWDGQDEKGQRVSSGIYFYRIQAGDYFKTRKMIILK